MDTSAFDQVLSINWQMNAMLLTQVPCPVTSTLVKANLTGPTNVGPSSSISTLVVLTQVVLDSKKRGIG